MRLCSNNLARLWKPAAGRQFAWALCCALVTLGVLAPYALGQARTPVPNGLNTAQAASVVIGQTNFSDITSGSDNARWGAISGIATAGNKLIVADSSYLAPPNNNRVLIYNDLNALLNKKPQDPLPNADAIVGQAGPGLTDGGTSNTQMFQPSGVASDGTRLFVSEWGNNRVLIFNQIPNSDGAAADAVIGQTDFNSQGFGTTATTLRRPNGVSTDGTRLFISDTLNNRILIYNSIPTSNGAAANVVIGQNNFTTFPHQATAANTMFDPMSATTDGQRLIVTDFGNNRVLIYNSIPTSNGAAADVVVGQPDFTSNGAGNTQTSLNFPRYAYSDGTRLAIVDSGNNRILIYNQIPTSNGAAADVVIGQEDFQEVVESCASSNMAVPFMATAANGVLLISDSSNRRVLGFQPGASMVTEVVNGASFSKTPQTAACNVVLLQPPVAPGGIATIMGTNLADSVQTAATIPLPTSMQNTQVTFNGILAPLYYVSPNQLNVQVPFEITGYSASMQILRTTASGTTASAAVPVGIADGAPGVFTLDSSGTGRAVITHADFSLVNDASPAAPGETLVAWVTGLGHSDQTLTTGAAAEFSSTGSVTVGGVVGAGQTVSITIDGRIYSYTAVTGNTIADIVNNLANVINTANDPEVTAAGDGTNSAVTLTAKNAGDQGANIIYSASVSEGSTLSASVGGNGTVPGSITFSGTPQVNQTVTLTLAGTSYAYTVVPGDTAASVVTKLAAIVDGDPNVSATADVPNLTINLALDDPASGLAIAFSISVTAPGAGITIAPTAGTVPAGLTLGGVVTANQTVTVSLQSSPYVYNTTSADTLASVVSNLAALINQDPNVSATADVPNLTINLANKTTGLTIGFGAAVARTDALRIDNGGAGSIPVTLTITGNPIAGQVATVFVSGVRYAYTVKSGDTAGTVATALGALLDADPDITAAVSGTAIDLEFDTGALRVDAGGATVVPATLTIKGNPRVGDIITVTLNSVNHAYTVVSGDTVESIAANLGAVLAADTTVTESVDGTTITLQPVKTTANPNPDSLAVSVTMFVSSVVTDVPGGFQAITSGNHFTTGQGNAKNTVTGFIGQTLFAVPGNVFFFGSADPGQTITVSLAGTTYSYTTVDGDTIDSVLTSMTAILNNDPNVTATVDTTTSSIALALKDTTSTVKIGIDASVTPAKTATLLVFPRSATTTDSEAITITFAGPVKGSVGLDQINFTVPTDAPDNSDTLVTFLQNLIVFGSVTNFNVYSAPITFPVMTPASSRVPTPPARQ